MKIAICDDEIIYIDRLKSHINSICKDRINVSIAEFSCGEELLKNFTANKYDIIILDIEMKDIDGIQTATKIRNTDKSVIIAFLTSHQEFAIKGYEVNAFRYILKGEPDYAYQNNLTSIFNEYNSRHKTFSVPYKEAMKEIPIKNIIYFEVYKRIITMHTISENIKFYGKLSEIEENENLIGFVKPYKSYFINLAFIENIDKNTITMKDKSSIPLSRNFKQTVTDSFVQYLTERC